jgi:hypothetical protein
MNSLQQPHEVRLRGLACRRASVADGRDIVGLHAAPSIQRAVEAPGGTR